jgi:hypothetical protein
MPTYKRIDGDYVITTVNSGDFVTINTHTVEINGNLNVRGNLTYIEVSELKVDDPFITVAANNTGSGNSALFPNQGLVAQTGINSFAGLRFHNETLEWQISDNVTADGAPITPYQPLGLATSGLPGGPVNAIQFNAGSDIFGGNSEFSYDSANSQVTLDGSLRVLNDYIELQGRMIYGNIGTPAPAVANSVVVYHNQVGSGGTGLYVRNIADQDELVSRKKAIVFGLIF